jgi:sarcosine oxidase, subunit gamma
MISSDSARRSFIYRRLTEANASVRPRPAGDFGLKLADLSLLARWGLKGRDAFDWLDAQGATTPGENNKAARQGDGSLIARLSPSEVLILSPFHDGSAIGRMIEDLPAEGRGACYPVPRRDSHAWFVVTGADAPRMFAKLCAIDLAVDRFPDGSIAQTSVARLSAVVIRNDLAGAVAFSVLAESASAEYLWDCVIDAMAEFSGTIAPLDVLRSEAAQ